MTNVDGTPDQGGSATATTVAESMSTVGYAMFALLQTGPLEGIDSMSDFMANLRVDDDLETVSTGVSPGFGDTFGDVEVNEELDAIPHNKGIPSHGGYPQPKDPVGAVPEYTGSQTLKMLDEISFLEE